MVQGGRQRLASADESRLTDRRSDGGPRYHLSTRLTIHEPEGRSVEVDQSLPYEPKKPGEPWK